MSFSSGRDTYQIPADTQPWCNGNFQRTYSLPIAKNDSAPMGIAGVQLS